MDLEDWGQQFWNALITNIQKAKDVFYIAKHTAQIDFSPLTLLKLSLWSYELMDKKDSFCGIKFEETHFHFQTKEREMFLDEFVRRLKSQKQLNVGVFYFIFMGILFKTNYLRKRLSSKF